MLQPLECLAVSILTKAVAHSMDPSQKISVLLAEYNTLRAEVLAARGNIAQAVGLTVPVIMGLIGLSFSPALGPPMWIIGAITAFAIAYLGLHLAWNGANTRAYTRQLRALEAQINNLAGERLLTWETSQGWGAMIYPRKAKLN
jgi:hypothetical protein